MMPQSDGTAGSARDTNPVPLAATVVRWAIETGPVSISTVSVEGW
jgi:hypothetical protein